MNPFRKNIVTVVEKVLENSGFFLIDLIIRGNENNPVIEVFIDGEKNITAKDCSNISLQMTKELDEEKSLSNTYRLDVSSPGIDRPLKYLKQYYKHLNRKFDLIIKQADEKKHLTGVLNKIDGDELTFLCNEELTVRFSDIIKASVLVSFLKEKG